MRRAPVRRAIERRAACHAARCFLSSGPWPSTWSGSPGAWPAGAWPTPGALEVQRRLVCTLQVMLLSCTKLAVNARDANLGFWVSGPYSFLMHSHWRQCASWACLAIWELCYGLHIEQDVGESTQCAGLQGRCSTGRAVSNVRVSNRLATLGNVTYLLVLAFGHIS